MGKETKIGWCDHTANLWWGCSEVHAGCDHCYARTYARAKGKASAWDGVRFAGKGIWSELMKWQRSAAEAGVMRRVFTGSMMDIFEKPMPASDWQGVPLDGVTTGDLRDRYFREVIPATPDLLHLLLTKRPGNVVKFVPPEWLKAWPTNVMVGTSVVNQETAETLVPQLLKVPGPRFLSIEPMLAEMDIFAWLDKIAWVICGGESGPKSRPMHPDWARSLRDQCIAAGVPYFFKQWGEWFPVARPTDADEVVRACLDHDGRWLEPDGWDVHRTWDCVRVVRLGKERAGNELDGRTWEQFPEVRCG